MMLMMSPLTQCVKKKSRQVVLNKLLESDLSKSSGKMKTLCCEKIDKY